MVKKLAIVLVVMLTVGVEIAAAAGYGNNRPRPGRCGGGTGWVRGFFRFAGLEVVGLTSDQRLICFDEALPAFARPIGNVNGLSGDSRLVGIDFRPATGELIGLGDAGGIYTIDVTNAAATFKSQLSLALDGDAFGIDFNPTVDRLRIISDLGQNLRVNVDTGAAIEDGDLAYPGMTPTPGLGLTGAAYTNNDGDASTATTLYDVDTTLDQVVVQSPANSGMLAATGQLGVDAVSDVGFDIYSVVRSGKTRDNRAFAALTTDRARFYRVDLLTGSVSYRGSFNQSQQVVDIALPLNQY